MSVDEGCSSFSVLGQFVCVYLMMCDDIFILTGHNKVLECKWDSVMLVFVIQHFFKEYAHKCSIYFPYLTNCYKNCNGGFKIKKMISFKIN